MKTVTYKELLTFEPCWLDDKEKAKELEKILTQKEAWTAMDILSLSNVRIRDKFWAVLREEFIEADVLHEFACRAAEFALAKVDNPDPRSVAAIEAKRKWLRKELTDEELAAARIASREAALSPAKSAARFYAWTAAWNAAMAAAGHAARAAASAAASAAARAAARYAAWSAAREATWIELEQILIALLEEGASE